MEVFVYNRQNKIDALNAKWQNIKLIWKPRIFQYSVLYTITG